MPEFDTVVRVDSAEEQYAYMLARFGDPAGWSVISQMFDTDDDDREIERVEVRVADGALEVVRFRAVRDEGVFATGEIEGEGDTGFLDALMETAFQFSAANPPHHPGTLARFPVPSAGYANALAVPMPVLAVDQGRRGLYAPPRVVVVDLPTGKARGVGDFPGFDPDSWPPRRLGDWPPASLMTLPQQQVQGSIMRFSALWKRVLDAWFSKELVRTPELAVEVREALELRGRLDLPEMNAIYEQLNPVFAKWLERHSVAD
ncbi:MAG TPA: hypothetical protein VEW66_05860 [Thermomicrobiales bacterium]|nr:hypothetical protein [Thermomicrobiales bacterium]